MYLIFIEILLIFYCNCVVMIHVFIQYICSYAFLNMPVGTATECLRVVSRLTQMNLSFLTKQSFMVIQISLEI